MKIATAVAAAALLLLVALVLLRTPSAPPPKAPTPPAGTMLPSAAPAPEGSRSAPAVAAPAPATVAAQGRSLLAELAGALHRGDDAAARAILDRLRLLLSPPVPDEENAARPILKALDSMGLVSPTKVELQAYGAMLSGKGSGKEDIAVLRGWLDENPDATGRLTELFREAANRPKCRFDPDPDRGIGLDGRIVPRLQRAAQFLCIQAAVLGAEGEGQAAGDSLRSALSLSRAVHSDPSVLSQMTGCALDAVATEILQRPGMLGVPGTSDVIGGLDPAFLRDSWSRALLGEACSAATNLLQWRADPGSASDPRVREWAQSARSADDVAAYVESLAEIQALEGRSHTERESALQGLALKYGASSPEYASLTRGILPAMPGIFRSLSQSEARFSAARVAMELHAYRGRRGVYPETLDALGIPLPVDPFSGLRFIYRSEGEGFRLESPSDPQRILWGTRP